MKPWLEKAAQHSLGHKMSEGLFVTGACGYCGLATIDFCPQCGIFVCRRCDVPKHWPDVQIFPEVGWGQVRRTPFRKP